MAEVLTLGLTHYPPLSGQDEKMSGILKRMLQNPELPEALRSPEGWPEGMRAEWSDDEGASAAKDHRDHLVDWMRKTRAALDAFNPDFIVIFGDDQYENFHEDGIPPYCVNAHPDFTFSIPSENIWNQPSDKSFKVAGAPAAGKQLVSALINEGFDAAYSYKPLHHSLGHAFYNAVLYLDYDRKGFDYPIIPISVNCYGRHVISQRGGLPQFDKPLTEADLDPPAPTPWRLFDFGAAIARILAASPHRVAIIASSGWSHAFLTPKNYFLYPDTPADRALFEALAAGNYKVWRDYPAAAVEESGQQEVLNWMCLAGALDALGRGPGEVGFIDTWIFNSSKAFLISGPDALPVDKEKVDGELVG